MFYTSSFLRNNVLDLILLENNVLDLIHLEKRLDLILL